MMRRELLKTNLTLLVLTWPSWTKKMSQGTAIGPIYKNQIFFLIEQIFTL